MATEVHHIIELNPNNVNDPNICLNESNLQSLCHECHSFITNSGGGLTPNILEQIEWTPDGYPVSAVAKDH